MNRMLLFAVFMAAATVLAQNYEVHAAKKLGVSLQDTNGDGLADCTTSVSVTLAEVRENTNDTDVVEAAVREWQQEMADRSAPMLVPNGLASSNRITVAGDILILDSDNGIILTAPAAGTNRWLMGLDTDGTPITVQIQASPEIRRAERRARLAAEREARRVIRQAIRDCKITITNNIAQCQAITVPGSGTQKDFNTATRRELIDSYQTDREILRLLGKTWKTE